MGQETWLRTALGRGTSLTTRRRLLPRSTWQIGKHVNGISGILFFSFILFSTASSFPSSCSPLLLLFLHLVLHCFSFSFILFTTASSFPSSCSLLLLFLHLVLHCFFSSILFSTASSFPSSSSLLLIKPWVTRGQLQCPD